MENKSNTFVVQWSWTLKPDLLIPQWNTHSYMDEEAVGLCSTLMILEHEAFDLKVFFKNSYPVSRKHSYTSSSGPLFASVFKHSDGC